MIVSVAVGTSPMFNRVGHICFMARFTGNRTVFVFKRESRSGMVEISGDLYCVECFGGMAVVTAGPEFSQVRIFVAIGTALVFQAGKMLELFPVLCGYRVACGAG